MKKINEHQLREYLGQAIGCRDADETANEVAMDHPIEQIYGIDESDLDFVQGRVADSVDGQRTFVPRPDMKETPSAYVARVNAALKDANNIRQQAEDQVHNGQERLAKLQQREKLEAQLATSESERELDELAYRQRQTRFLDEMQSTSAKLSDLNRELGLEDY